MPSTQFGPEVIRLHDFLQSWFCGDRGSSIAEFSDALAHDFRIISPDGTTNTRDEVVSMVELTRNSGPVEISIVSPQVLLEGAVTVGTYEEHQTKNGCTTKRISTAVLTPALDAPGGWLWHLVHETWLSGYQPDQA